MSGFFNGGGGGGGEERGVGMMVVGWRWFESP